MRRRGYTLIEVTLAVVLVAMLATAGAVIGLRVTRATQETSARVLLDTVTAAELSHAGRSGGYTTDASRLGVIDGATITSGPSTGPDEVSLALGSGGTLVIAVRNEDGSCSVRTLTDILAGAARTDTTSDAACDAVTFLPLTETPVS